jgi:tRNA 2-thiouridine synthesizing protein A
MADATLDARGLSCPLPVLKARKLLRGMATGQTLEVLATDPGAKRDFIALCKATGDVLLAQAEADGVLTFLLRRA